MRLRVCVPIEAALRFDERTCPASWASLTRSGDIHCPLVLVFGKQDPHVPAEGRLLIHQTLSQNECDFSWHEVNAQHAFMRDEGDRFDAAIALQIYKMAIDFFHHTLRN